MTYVMNILGADGGAKQFVHKDIVPDRIAEDRVFTDILEKVGGHTMTIQNGAGATYNLFKSIKYVSNNNIQGSFVECGVWQGGSAMLMAYALQYFKDASRDIYLYDTYEGMTEPDVIDVDFDGRNLKEIWEYAKKTGGRMGYGGSVENVAANLKRTGYPAGLMHFVKGDVMETIPRSLPEKIALLRLDTDFYASTLHELKHLYPLVVSKGVIFIDDYGWCEGARRATDEYLATLDFPPLPIRIDECVRILLKP
jgi:predicted O-methyltransferase YrrM